MTQEPAEEPLVEEAANRRQRRSRAQRAQRAIPQAEGPDFRELEILKAIPEPEIRRGEPQRVVDSRKRDRHENETTGECYTIGCYAFRQCRQHRSCESLVNGVKCVTCTLMASSALGILLAGDRGTECAGHSGREFQGGVLHGSFFLRP